jgi:hypothetical protein
VKELVSGGVLSGGVGGVLCVVTHLSSLHSSLHSFPFTLYLSPIPHLSTMVLAAVFAHCHAKVLLENGFCVIYVAEATLLCQT